MTNEAEQQQERAPAVVREQYHVFPGTHDTICCLHFNDGSYAMGGVNQIRPESEALAAAKIDALRHVDAGALPPRPTIEELERILASNENPGIEIAPDGSLRRRTVIVAQGQAHEGDAPEETRQPIEHVHLLHGAIQRVADALGVVGVGVNIARDCDPQTGEPYGRGGYTGFVLEQAVLSLVERVEAESNTAERVIPAEEIARVAHEVNRAYCQALGDNSQLPWDEAPDWQRQSALDGVAFHVAWPSAGPTASHENWMKQKFADGWTHGPEKNAEAKTHPCIVPFHDLPVEQQAKDFIFCAVVRALTG